MLKFIQHINLFDHDKGMKEFTDNIVQVDIFKDTETGNFLAFNHDITMSEHEVNSPFQDNVKLVIDY